MDCVIWQVDVSVSILPRGFNKRAVVTEVVVEIEK